MAVALANKTIQNPRLKSLRDRHSALSTKIEREYQSLSNSDAYIRQLKVEKLKLKEEIEKISQAAA